MRLGVKAVSAALAAALALTGCSGGDAFDAGKDVTVVSRESGSGTRGAFIELFGIEVKGDDGSKTDTTTQEAAIATNTEVMLQDVSGDKYAIGYVSLGSINDTVKALEIDGVKATTDNVKNGSYKISRPFIIAYKDGVSEIAADFMSFIMSSDGQAIVGKSYIPVDENASPYAGGKPSGKVVVAGSSSVTPIMEKLREAYIVVNPNATVEVLQSDSTTGITAAGNGTCDIGMSSRELKDSEKASLKDTTIALDGIAVIVNPDNPDSDLTKERVRSIFTGETTKWSGLK